MEPNVRFELDSDRADLKLNELLDLTYYELINEEGEDEDFNEQ